MIRVRSIVLSLFLVFTSAHKSDAQEKPPLYHPEADAKKEFAIAVSKAAKEHKNVFLQIGGNWCKWCIRFHNLVESNDSLRTLMDANYVVVHVNYSPENKNEPLLEKLGKPQKYGFPVFVILNGKGKVIHTQNSGDLEEGNGHSPQKVSAFLRSWTYGTMPASLNKH